MTKSCIVLVAVTLALAACGQDQELGDVELQSVSADTTISPASVLQNMARVLAPAEAFSVHIEKIFDEVMRDGAKVQYSGAADVSVRHPGWPPH